MYQNYVLRSCPIHESCNNLDLDEMNEALFDLRNDNVILSLNQGTLCALYEILMKESIHGPKPILPLSTIESFIDYLFFYCRDLRLIRVLLNIFQGNPCIMGRFDQIVKKKMGSNLIGLREYYMLPFLLKIHKIDQKAFDSTLQLMGFLRISDLLRFYAKNPEIVLMDPKIGDAIDRFENDFYDSRDDFMDSDHEQDYTNDYNDVYNDC